MLTDNAVFGFASISGQKQSIRLLTNLLKSKAIPHALLFTGNQGIGKNRAALVFAAVCNCISIHGNNFSGNDTISNQISFNDQVIEPCGHCKSCRKIKTGNHPDIIQIKPDNNTIKIDQIRNLCRTLGMKPYEARLRVVIISDAQTMNTSSANALLKALEEPSEDTIFILIATERSDLLPTIVSRCQHFKFNPISRDNIKSMLIQQLGLDDENATILAELANGSYSQAIAMNNSGWISYRKWILEQTQSLHSKTTGSILMLAEKLSKNKDQFEYALQIILSYLRDLIICKFKPEKIINIDIANKIHIASQNIDINSTLSKIRAVQNMQHSMDSNINLRIALEILILKLAK